MLKGSSDTLCSANKHTGPVGFDLEVCWLFLTYQCPCSKCGSGTTPLHQYSVNLCYLIRFSYRSW